MLLAWQLNPDYALDFVVRDLNGCEIGTRADLCNGNIAPLW